MIFDKARMDGALNIQELIERLKNLSNIFMIQPRLFVYISHFAFTIFCLVIVCLNNDIDAKMMQVIFLEGYLALFLPFFFEVVPVFFVTL